MRMYKLVHMDALDRGTLPKQVRYLVQTVSNSLWGWGFPAAILCARYQPGGRVWQASTTTVNLHSGADGRSIPLAIRVL